MRAKKSGRRNNPSEPITVNSPPMTSSNMTGMAAHNGISAELMVQ
jgi:hypothetical protein